MSSSLFNVGHCLLKFSLSSINSNAEYKEDIYHSFKQRSSSVTFLFIATLGPVQPFIASSRRTRDLFAGSALLSELSKAAARAIVVDSTQINPSKVNISKIGLLQVGGLCL